MSLQEALKLLRLELGLTQENLAEKLNKAYITINRWENGKGFPSRSNARAILDIARKGNASKDCIDYLNEVLLPDTKRNNPATSLGFPEIDREFLFQLADGSTNAIYVIEAGTYHLLYTNRKAESQAVQTLSEMGIHTNDRKLKDQEDKRCFHYFANRDTPCTFCPLVEINSNYYKDVIIQNPVSGSKLLVHAKTSEVNKKRVYIIYLIDVTQVYAERNAMYELANDIPAGVGIYHLYLDDRIELEYMNTELSNMIGEERSKLMLTNGPADISLVHPKDKVLLKAEINKSIAEKRDISIDMQMRLNGGEYHMIHLDAKIINKGKEKLTYYCLFHLKSELEGCL